MRYIWLFLLLVSCWKPIDDVITGDPELTIYAYLYRNDVGYGITEIDFQFADLPEGVSGECIFYNGDKRILIDKKQWDIYSSSQREILMFHEIHHCARLCFTHDSRTLPNGQPRSIMYPRIFNDIWYLSNRDYYIKELREHSCNSGDL